MDFVTTPEDRTHLSMTSTDIGCDVQTVGILCARTNEISIKQVETLESSKVGNCIEVDPKQILNFKAKPHDGVTEL